MRVVRHPMGSLGSPNDYCRSLLLQTPPALNGPEHPGVTDPTAPTHTNNPGRISNDCFPLTLQNGKPVDSMLQNGGVCGNYRYGLLLMVPF